MNRYSILELTNQNIGYNEVQTPWLKLQVMTP